MSTSTNLSQSDLTRSDLSQSDLTYTNSILADQIIDFLNMLDQYPDSLINEELSQRLRNETRNFNNRNKKKVTC
jgi:uncharacterized protein YjbI with pentapeptide repeats